MQIKAILKDATFPHTDQSWGKIFFDDGRDKVEVSERSSRSAVAPRDASFLVVSQMFQLGPHIADYHHVLLPV